MNTRLLKFCSALFLSAQLAALPLTAWGYIPNSKTIVTRLARNNGRGVYVIEQEVRFNGAAEGSSLKERWLVQNGDVMRLIVTGLQQGEFRWDSLYREGKRWAPALPDAPIKDAKGGLTTTSMTSELLESFLYFRSSTRFYEAFIRNKILPNSAMRDRPKITKIETYKPQPEVGVSLGRAGGVIAWVFGEPGPVDSGVNLPGAWIEQDTFLLRKVRLPSQAEMVLSNHQPAGGGLRLARERSLIWKSNDPLAVEPRSATIKVLSVKNFPEKSLAPQFQASSISASEIKAARLPTDPIVREFYSRFR